MLLSLRIENFVLIDALVIHFGAGLNVLTGETGAGKSIVLDALDVVLGGKVSSRMVRVGREGLRPASGHRTTLEAEFRLTSGLRDWLQEIDIDPLEGEGLLCSRELSQSEAGLRSRSRVNGVIVNRQQVQQLRERVVEITAQGQTVQLVQGGRQRDWLDAFGGQKLQKLRSQVAVAHRDFLQTQQTLGQYRATEQQRLQQRDLLHFQHQELQQAELSNPDEADLLAQEFQRLSHSVELQAQSQQVYQLLYEQEQGAACADQLGKAVQLLEDMSTYDPQIQPLAALVQEALTQVEEAGRQIHTYGDLLETDPQRLQAISERMTQLKQICRKYGPTLTDALAYQVQVEADYQALTDGATSVEALEQASQASLAVLEKTCAQLSRLRRQAAQALEERLLYELKPLAMEKVQFQVQLTPVPPSGWGCDRITFLLSPNPGEPLQPLAETASGGEMSRFLLALKACFSRVDAVETLVFDEIDVGVSGQVAEAIAAKLHHLSHDHQVLCVTHQPIIAAMADHHFRVEKQTLPAQGADPERTVIRVHTLDLDQRRQELAQIAGGRSTQGTLAFVDTLLHQVATLRQPLSANP
ncbi:DNA repair protein RecN [Synechococcales cyanobacterium C]|uniref:DNA repair protein RecN n=1 Tax=Petrachloros mirabilis ULC683 TaxID=2781853 RepID=A0A8K1ZZK5_9CYAN|nr:DNA repair protein RecN [Petrachloros mirabilis]NCJ06722.1 DNA repair protein RecN [Petrachloros mirabilis ULC683]